MRCRRSKKNKTSFLRLILQLRYKIIFKRRMKVMLALRKAIENMDRHRASLTKAQTQTSPVPVVAGRWKGNTNSSTKTVKGRWLMIENSMSNAIIRKCWTYNRRFVKDGGCSAVVCVCGTTTWYNCGDILYYKLGTTRLMFPVYSDSENTAATVLAAARRVKSELLNMHSELASKWPFNLL